MKQYDVIVVGGATSGLFLARRVAETGKSVLVIDALSEEKIGTRYDIFHISKPDFARFGLPEPVDGEDKVFEYTDGENCSAFGNYPKSVGLPVVGMHLHPYTLRMNRWAARAGAEVQYGARFDTLLYTDGRISGIVYERDGEKIRAGAKLVADCSGIPSVVRRQLPADYGVENFEFTPRDMFYVTLRYVRYLEEKDWSRGVNRSWPFYKAWEAPQADPHGRILGIGANLSFETGEKKFRELEAAVKLPRYELQRTERSVTPYRRPPYSFVADSFLVSGDAASLTKPGAGEGVASSMVQLDIAAGVINELLEHGRPLTRENLWSINKRYVEAQGSAFAAQLATVVGAVATSARENDFFFEKDVIFSSKTFESLSQGRELKFSPGETAAMAGKMLGGILGGRLRVSTVRALLRSMTNGNKISALYEEYPETPEGFEEWCVRADEQWGKCGSMADTM